MPLARKLPPLFFLLAALPLTTGCGHTARTARMRSALDEGRPEEAIAALDDELDVKSPSEMPEKLEGDNALLVLDRASIQQSVGHYPLSAHDFEAADKAIDMLDLSHTAADTLAAYIYSGSAERYVAPAYEKLLINTLNMVNYLERGDLQGAKVESRRLSVLQRYFADVLHEPAYPVSALGALLAGFAFEKSGDPNEALHYYDDALAFKHVPGFDSAIRRLVESGATYSSPRIKALMDAPPSASGGSGTPDDAELLVVAGYGRVPHKYAKRIPIGLALTYFAADIHPNDVEAANKLAVQGLVTWVNYPVLGDEQAGFGTPELTVDGHAIGLTETVDVTSAVRSEWHKMEGKIVASAITRAIARAAAGIGIQKAGNDSLAAFLISLGVQAAATVADVPDTRSWETLPARVVVNRIRLPAGEHRLHLASRSVIRDETITLEKGGYKVISLMALR